MRRPAIFSTRSVFLPSQLCMVLLCAACGMDDALLAEFHSVFSVSGDVNAPHRPHPNFSSLYKQKRAGFGDQEARRRRQLDQQKSRRKDYADYVRRIVDGEEWEEEMDEDDDDGEDEVDMGDAKKRKKIHPYRNQLMLSEWLVDTPADFTENWLMTVCPVGKRSLIVAAKSTTIAYSRGGAFLNTFPSLLPGGCKRMCHTAKQYSILDCILHEPSRTYFVLDIMCWRAHPVYDTDREFRYYWLCTKLSEVEGVKEASRINPYRFVPLDAFPCSRDSLTSVLSKPWPVEVDGLLFFHKQCHYKAGHSPLAVWLKAHMVPDVLGVSVSEEFLSCAPRMADPLAEPAGRQQQQKQQIEGDLEGEGELNLDGQGQGQGEGQEQHTCSDTVVADMESEQLVQ